MAPSSCVFLVHPMRAFTRPLLTALHQSRASRPQFFNSCQIAASLRNSGARGPSIWGKQARSQLRLEYPIPSLQIGQA
eukprot:3937454-Rhodomonas_salina.2